MKGVSHFFGAQTISRANVPLPQNLLQNRNYHTILPMCRPSCTITFNLDDEFLKSALAKIRVILAAQAHKFSTLSVEWLQRKRNTELTFYVPKKMPTDPVMVSQGPL